MNDSTPIPHKSPRAWESIIPAFVALAVYIYTLPPSFSGEDSGELIAAAYTLGIPHPTGYPLWTLLANGFINLIPFGDIGWRATLLSSVFGAITVAIVHRFIIDLTQNRWAAIAGALALAFSREFWEQSVIAEVYTLNAFFVVICLYLAYRYHQSPDNNKIAYALVFLFSLGLSNHSTMFLLGPVLAFSLWKSNPATLRTPRIIITFSLLFLLGLSIHLYLPIRSAANPAMDWGNPENWANFWSVITREQYQGIITDSPRSLSRFLWQCSIFLKQYAWEFTPWLAWLPILGCIALFKKSTRPAATLLASSLAIITMASIIIPNFGPIYHDIWVNTTYYIPIYAIAAIYLGVALHTLATRYRMPMFIQTLIVVIITISPLVVHFHHNNMRDYHHTRDYAYNLLGTMEPDAIYFGSGDHTIFPMVYLQVVEGLRPDVTLANKYGYPDTELLTELPHPPDSFPPSEADESRLFAWIMNNSDRPVYSVVRRPSGTRKAVRNGLLYRYLKPGETVDVNAPWEHYTWRNSMALNTSRGDWTTELIQYELFYAEAERKFDEGIDEAGISSLENARWLIHKDPGALNNIGVLYARHGHLDEAEEEFATILDADPRHFSALLNIAKVRLKQNRPQDALKFVERALIIQPDSEPAQRLKEKALPRLSPAQDQN